MRCQIGEVTKSVFQWVIVYINIWMNIKFHNWYFIASDIPYKLILAVMDRHNIKDGDMNLMVPPFQLTSLIHDIFYACEKLGHFTKVQSYSLESATAVLSNFFWNIFDP